MVLESAGDVEPDEQSGIVMNSSTSGVLSTCPITTSSALTNTRLTGFGAMSMTFLTSCSARRVTGKPPTSRSSLPTFSGVAVWISWVTVLTKMTPVRFRLSVNPGAVTPPHMISTVRGADASGSEASHHEAEKDEEDDDVDNMDEWSDRHWRRLFVGLLDLHENEALNASIECCDRLRLMIRDS